MKKILAAALLAVCVLTLSAEKYVINSARKGSIQQLVVLGEKNLIFTGDENGYIQVISSQYNHIIKNFRSGTSGISLMAAHPDGTQLALITQESEKYYLSIWDWKTGKRLNRIKLTELPLTLAYSTLGKYIYYSKISSPSVVLVSSKTGKPMSYLRSNPYNLQDVYIGSSEEQVMGYSASGDLYYLDIKTSKLKGERSTISELQGMEVIQTGNKRYFTAWKGTTLYLIDRLTGATMDSRDFKEISFVSLEKGSNTIAVMSGRQNTVLNLFKIEDNQFVPLESQTRIRKTQFEDISIDSPQDNLINLRFNHLLTQMVFENGIIYLAFNNGDIYNFSIREKSIERMIANVLSELDNFVLEGENLFLTSDNYLVKINTAYFREDKKQLTTLEEAQVSIKKTDFSNTLLSLDNNEDYSTLFYYGKDTLSPYLMKIDPETMNIVEKKKLDSSISALDIHKGNIFMLETSGTIHLMTQGESENDFRYSALGIQDAVYLDENRVAAGKNISRSADSPLYLINTQTKETIPLLDDRFLVYDLDFDNSDNALYSIGLKEDSKGEITTTLVMHKLEDLNTKSKTVLSASEDLNAFVKMIDGTITTNLGKQGFSLIDGNRRSAFNSSKEVNDILLNEDLAFTLNEDYSLSLWNRRSRKEIISFYLFSDGEWAAIPTSDDADVFYCSSGGLNYVSREVSGKIYQTYNRNAVIK